METFQTVFDVSSVGYRWGWFAATGLVFVVLGTAALLIPGIANNTLGGSKISSFAWFAIAAGGIWSVGVFSVTYYEYRASVRVLKGGKVQRIEGIVKEFHPMPATGHSVESFSVEGVKFEYSDYVVSSGYNTTSAKGGVIRPGLVVRIWYLDGKILRLDVSQTMPKPSGS